MDVLSPFSKLVSSQSETHSTQNALLPFVLKVSPFSETNGTSSLQGFGPVRNHIEQCRRLAGRRRPQRDHAASRRSGGGGRGHSHHGCMHTAVIHGR